MFPRLPLSPRLLSLFAAFSGLSAAYAGGGDSTAPTCEIVRSTIAVSPFFPNGFRFTFFTDAADDQALQTYTGAKGPIEYRARVDGGGFGRWSPWPLDFNQPIYIDVECRYFRFEVRSVDAAGNRSARAFKEFNAPFALAKPAAKAVFGVARNFSTGGQTARGLIAGQDFDGDGHSDFAQADHDSGIVKVRRNTAGKGKNYVAVDLPFLANSVDALAAGQIASAAASGANDARPDLVVASNAEITVELNQGVDVGGALRLTAQTPLSVADHYLKYVAVADLNGDGFSDIAATASPFAGNADPSAKVAVFLNLGAAGGFAPAVLYSFGTVGRDIQLGDLTGDGFPDVVVAESSSVKVLINSGSGAFGTAESSFTSGSPQRVAVADLTGDGKLDIVAGTTAVFALPNGKARHFFGTEILRNDGSGRFAPLLNLNVVHVDLPAPTNFDCAVAVGDLNADGRPDIIAGCEFSKVAKIFHLQPLKNGAQEFLALLYRGKSVCSSGGKIRAIALANLNAGSQRDIVFTNTSGTNQTTVLRNAR